MTMTRWQLSRRSPVRHADEPDPHLGLVLHVLAGIHPQFRAAWMKQNMPVTAGLLAARGDWEQLTVLDGGGDGSLTRRAS